MGGECTIEKAWLAWKLLHDRVSTDDAMRDSDMTLLYGDGLVAYLSKPLLVSKIFMGELDDQGNAYADILAKHGDGAISSPGIPNLQ
ncbi:hypothetical protein C5167_031001 [Papaver somniferum]|nr:hypothetical protein C5167_031001 [Papaver somniferum]